MLVEIHTTPPGAIHTCFARGQGGGRKYFLIRSCRLVLIVSGEPPCVLIRFLIALSRAENSMARNKIDEIAKLRKVVEQVRS